MNFLIVYTPKDFASIVLLHNIGTINHPNYNTREEIQALPPDTLLTFDGIYKNVYENRDLLVGRPVILFIIGSVVGKDNTFNTGVPREEYCSWAELFELQDMGCELAWHTQTHPNLTEVTDDWLSYEITPPRNIPMKSFAYPYGKFNDKVLKEVKKHFTYAYAVNEGDNSNYQINRKYIRY